MGQLSRSHALRGDRLRRRRLIACAPRIALRRRDSPRATGSPRAARRVGRRRARPSAAHSHSLRRRARACCGASSATDGRSSTPISLSRWRCGTCGRRSPPTRSRSSRRRRALRSTGGRLRAGASAASLSPRCRTPPASPRPATRRSTTGFRSTNFFAFPARARPLFKLRSRDPGASSRSGRASCARSNPPPTPTERARGRGRGRGRIGRGTKLRMVDAILTGVHQPGESHYELLRAFADDRVARPRARGGERARLPRPRVRRFAPDRARDTCMSRVVRPGLTGEKYCLSSNSRSRTRRRHSSRAIECRRSTGIDVERTFEIAECRARKLERGRASSRNSFLDQSERLPAAREEQIPVRDGAHDLRDRLDGEERDRYARGPSGRDAFGSSAAALPPGGSISYCSAGETRDQKSLNSILSNIANALVTLPSCISKSQK